jgi:NifU-like protein involved in Fe-S cluster formation
MDHFVSPRNAGLLDAPDAIGQVGTPGRGPFFVMALNIEKEMVLKAKFQTHGCGASIAAGSVLTQMVCGRTVSECLALTAEDVIAALEGVPPNKLHGPTLAVLALREALRGR